MVVAYASNQVPVTWYQSGSMTTEKLNSANSALVAELIKKGTVLIMIWIYLLLR